MLEVQDVIQSVAFVHQVTNLNQFSEFLFDYVIILFYICCFIYLIIFSEYFKNGYTLYLNSGLSSSRNHYGQRVITREADLVTAQ